MRHGPGAHVIILSGEGYSLMWPEGEEPQRYEWEVGHADRSAQPVVPPALQHRARRRRATSRSSTRASRSATPRACPRPGSASRLGGDQIDYADEQPAVRQLFAEALAKNGLESRMDKAYDDEAVSLPPQQEPRADQSA